MKRPAEVEALSPEVRRWIGSRAAAAATARAGGWFWLPCPVCGDYFGGHEWRDIDGLPSTVPAAVTGSIGNGICPTCTEDGYGYPWDFFGVSVEEYRRTVKISDEVR